jgi:hypothetical protein
LTFLSSQVVAVPVTVEAVPAESSVIQMSQLVDLYRSQWAKVEPDLVSTTYQQMTMAVTASSGH